jgi:hypothetical protein
MRTINFTDKGQVIELTTSELTEILKGKDKGTWCYMITETKVRMNKTGNPYFNQVIKRSYLNVLLGNSYQNRVIKETGDTDFIPEVNKVGEHISKCVLHNENTGKDYLQYENFDYKSIPNYPKNLIPSDPEYNFNGDPIEKRLFESYMMKYSPNKYGVTFMSVTIENIKECHLDGNVYKVINTVGVEVEQRDNVVVE